MPEKCLRWRPEEIGYLPQKLRLDDAVISKALRSDSTRAIACARALREAFKVDFEDGRMYPGSKCEVSCGIAVGHQNAPLQMLVREAQKAEKRAKKEYGRTALAVSLYKRSGEIIEWGCKWAGGALDLMAEITGLTDAGKLSGRFPYALAGLLRPCALKQARPDELQAMLPVVQAEVRHVLSRQGTGLGDKELEALEAKIDCYLEACWSPEGSGPGGSAEDPGRRTRAPGPRTQDPGRGTKDQGRRTQGPGRRTQGQGPRTQG